MSIIKYPEKWRDGKVQVEWALQHMPALKKIYEDYKDIKPFKDIRITLCLHITKETGAFVKVLKDLGGVISLTASNPLTTQDDVAAYLAKIGVDVFGWRGESSDDYYQMMHTALDIEPNLVVDDGGDLHSLIHSERRELTYEIYGGTEETTTGVIRLRAMERQKVLKYPVIAVNDTPTKRIFDNKYGTGQSTLDGIMRATALLIAGKVVVVAGYGYVGKGVALRARGLGAKVIVTEVDPIKAIEAHLDGFEVMPMEEAAKRGDIFITCTGMKDVIRKEHLIKMKDGALLANAGHFNVEINLNDLESISRGKERIRDYVDKYILKDGRKLYLLGKGRLINLVAAEGHPPEVMMNSFSNQLLSLVYILENREKLSNKVYNVPLEIDQKVARYTLEGWNIKIDELSDEQKKYWESWKI